jgi:transketolase
MSTSIDTLKEKARRMRVLSLRATTEAGSGHPSSCLSAADLASVLFFQEMRYDPMDPKNADNDRFVLSKGHAAPLLYAAWAEAGIVEESATLTLRNFDSDLEGHPTPRLPWVGVATGSLGQGLSAGLGMALAARMDKLDYNTYVLMGDGECAEGSVWEAAALAGHYKTENLVAIVDVNGIGQSQRTMYGFDVDHYADRFRAFGWFAVTVDGHDHKEISDAFDKCRTEAGQRPRAIIAKTFKGKGVSLMENLDNWHGKPVPRAQLDDVLAELSTPHAGDGFEASPRTRPPSETPPADHRISVTRELGDMVATREAYGEALAKLVALDARVVALDGDTKNSTFSDKVLKAHEGNFFEMFIAEQNMVGVAAGMSSCGKIPFVSTFAAFLTRAFDQIRMARISYSDIRFAGSHCGVSIGQDGPSQMGLEDIAMFRTIPDSVVVYPSDAVSTEHLVAAIADRKGISYIRTSRPKTPVIYGSDEVFEIGGSKVVRRSDNDKLTIVAAGITLHESLKAYDTLLGEGTNVRVVDAYSVKPIDQKTLLEAARETGGKLIVVEDHFWEGGLGDAVLNAVGSQAEVHKLAVRGVPRSGTPDELLDAFGISATQIAQKVRSITSGASNRVSPAL